MSELVLIVDDEPGILSSLSSVLSDEGYSTVCTESGEQALELYRDRKPDAVFLDIWLPDRDGLETLQALRQADPTAAVIMMSGHGTTSTAVKALKMGAFDYVEKPLSYGQAVDSVQGAIAYRRNVSAGGSPLASVAPDNHLAADFDFSPPDVPLLQTSDVPQRTLAQSTVLYGLGLHSGFRTGMVIQPLPPDSGIHFVTLPTNTHIPAFVGRVAETSYATTLTEQDIGIKTVEHFLSACHAYGVTNALVKVHGELPVLDGSSAEFCKTFEDVGLVDQDRPRKEIVIDRVYKVNGDGEKSLTLEPSEHFEVSYLLDYPPPVGRQSYEYGKLETASYLREVAPARTFGFVKDLDMMNELGLGTGGRLDNCILVGEDDIINTELRFPDEFVRHKILDVIGDLYLLGYPVRGKVTASLTGHRDNIAILRKILQDNQRSTATP